MTRSARFSLIFSMTVFGTIGLLRRMMPFSSGFIAMTRGLIGALFLLLWKCAAHEVWDGAALKKNMGRLVLSGVLIGLNWMCLFEAYRFTSVAAATICYYMAPVIVVFVSPLVLHEKLTRRKAVCALLAVLGMVPVSGVLSTGLTGLTGVLLALAAAAMYASVILLNKSIDALPATDRTLFQLFFAGACMVPYVLFTGDVTAAAPTPLHIALLLVLCLLHTGYAYRAYFGAIRVLSAQTSALLSYIDPIVAVLLSVLVLHENMTPLAAAGALLTIGAMLWGERETA